MFKVNSRHTTDEALLTEVQILNIFNELKFIAM